MKTILAIFLTIFLATEIQSQVVTGKIVDENGDGLSSVGLQLYINPDIYNTTTSADGSFTFNVVTSVEGGQIPSGYAVSNNFPNPFNPTTRIGITLPVREDVKIEVLNLLGQEVKKPIEQTYEAGTNFIDIELNDLANGVYAARVTIGDKHIFVKKMMLVYGSRHLTLSSGQSNIELQKINNTNLGPNLDSLVATSQIIGRKTFTDLPGVTGDTLDMGNLVIERYCIGTPTVEYEGKIYNTVQIGDQCWLKENLDVGTMILGGDTANDNGVVEKYCYNNDTTNCNTYGGLYQWNEAMQYTTTPGTRGICPEGWHIPTVSRFETLSNTVGGDGNALKAIGQGDSTESEDGRGTNASGFSALLAGDRGSSGFFYNLSTNASFWSSSGGNETYARYIGLHYAISYIGLCGGSAKELGYSVRCIRDKGANSPPRIPSNPSPADNDTSVFTSVMLRWSCIDPDEDSIAFDIYFGTDNPPETKVESNLQKTVFYRNGLSDNTIYYWQIVAKDDYGDSATGPVWRFTTGGPFGLPCPGTLTVEYSGKIYNTVQIGSQCWLKENLDVGSMIPGSDTAKDNGIIEKYCYNNSIENCNIYGGLYQWNEAMQYTTTPGARGICPVGWHIPTPEEFGTLSNTVGGDGNAFKAIGQGDSTESGDGRGTNTSGFSALLAGGIGSSFFYNLSDMAFFWSTECSSTYAYYMGLHYDNSYISLGTTIYKAYGFSVRCLKD